MKDNLVLAKNIVKEFCNEWNIELPKIKVVNNSSYTLQNKSFGGYMPDTGEIIWVIYKRNFADALRSLIHELYHHYQNSQNLLNIDSGEDGDEIENEANAFAGVVLRKIGREYPQIYEYE